MTLTCGAFDVQISVQKRLLQKVANAQHAPSCKINDNAYENKTRQQQFNLEWVILVMAAARFPAQYRF